MKVSFRIFIMRSLLAVGLSAVALALWTAPATAANKPCRGATVQSSSVPVGETLPSQNSSPGDEIKPPQKSVETSRAWRF
jgi:hypothetical protein